MSLKITKPVSLPVEAIMLATLMALTICYRIYILNVFGFIYTDSDQTIMWLATKNYSEGCFPEPRFYGQDYNTMLEALLAVPLYKLGVPVYKALPVITSILALLPYFIIALIAYFKASKFTGIVIVALPLLLPVEYELITCLSRGFVTGLAIASICIVPLFYDSKRNLFLAGCAMIIAYSVNANSVLFSMPCLLLLLLRNYKNKDYYFYTGMGLGTGLTLHLAVTYFYILHPNYVLHSFTTNYSLENLWEGLTFTDKYFNHLTPVFSRHGWMIFVILGIFSILLFKLKKREEGITVTFILLLILLPFSASKIHDGTTSVFYSHSRMFLAVPVLIALTCSFIIFSNHFFKWGYILAVCLIFFFKILSTQDLIIKNMNNSHVVTVIKTSELQDECKRIAEISAAEAVDLIIINNHFYYDIYNYGCPACVENFPNTLRPIYERRTWRLIEEENKVNNTVMIIEADRRLNEEFEFVFPVNNKAGFYLIHNNHLTTKKLLETLKIDLRKY